MSIPGRGAGSERRRLSVLQKKVPKNGPKRSVKRLYSSVRGRFPSHRNQGNGEITSLFLPFQERNPLPHCPESPLSA